MLIEMSKELYGLAGLALGAGMAYLGTRHTAATNLRIAQEKLETENKLPIAASAAIKALLLEPDWELRSFDAIRKHIRGFSDDELRKLLVACGAVAFQERGSERELWGLRERNTTKLQPSPNQQQFDIEDTSPAPDDR